MLYTENELATIVFDVGLKVHRTLGPGLLESVYVECLYYELCQCAILVEKQKPLPVAYGDVELEVGYRLDLILDNKLILEIKSVAELSDLHLAQMLTYLKLGDCKLGLLINFNTVLFKNGFKRVINGTLR